MRVLVINLEFPWDSDKEVRAIKRQETIDAMESIGIDTKHMPKSWLESCHDFMVTETQLTDLVVWGYKFRVVQQADYGIDNAALTQRNTRRRPRAWATSCDAPGQHTLPHAMPERPR